MHSYSFTARGHPNIKATHKTTLEFTKDKEVTPKGDCIVGVDADYDLFEIKQFIAPANKKVKIILEVGGVVEELEGKINPNFEDDKEIVLRKTGFLSKRTLLVHSTKSAQSLKRKMVNKLADSKQKIIITLLF